MLKKVKNEKRTAESEELEKLKNQLARVLADYDNLRKRVESEKLVWEKMAASKAILSFLPVFDMLINVQKHLKDAGLEIVVGEFRKSLFSLGVEEIKIGIGEEFDPLKAEVVEVVAGEGKENTVAEVVQTGWKIKDENFIIRPVKVKVFKVVN